MIVRHRVSVRHFGVDGEVSSLAPDGADVVPGQERVDVLMLNGLHTPRVRPVKQPQLIGAALAVATLECALSSASREK